MARIAPSLDASPRDGIRSLVGFAIAIAGLYFGSEIFVPIALAILLSFVLAPGVRFLQHAHLGRVVPVLVMTGLAFCVIAGIGTLIALQVGSLAEQLPHDEATVVEKIETLRDMTSDGPLSRFSTFVEGLGQRLHQSAKQEPAPVASTTGGESAKPPQTPPLAVTVVAPPQLPVEILSRYLAPAVHPLLLAGIVAIYVIFMLLQRDDLRNRAIRLFGAGDLHASTAAIDEAARRLSRYLLTQLAINATAGSVATIGLAIFGVPSPILWGILFGALRFVPYVGPPLAAIPPVALAAAAAPGWTLAFEAAALYTGVELIVGQVVEPFAYGHNTGLSPVAVVVAATFWTVLWGPIGLVLATPVTVCLVVLGRHVEPLAFLDVMLGDRPALEPAEMFYQRTLADDPAEASDQAERMLKEMTLVDYYDGVMLPALLLAQDDVSQGRLDTDRQRRIAACAIEVVDDLADRNDGPEVKDGTLAHNLIDRLGHAHREGQTAGAETPDLPRDWRRPGAVLCIGGRGPLDDAAAAALAQVLAKHGFGVRAVSFEMLTRARLPELELDAARLVCLSCLDGHSAAFLRFLLRRLGRRGTQAPILIGAWWRQRRKGEAASDDDLPRRRAGVATGAVPHKSVTTLAEALTAAMRIGLESDGPDAAVPEAPAPGQGAETVA